MENDPLEISSDNGGAGAKGTSQILGWGFASSSAAVPFVLWLSFWDWLILGWVAACVAINVFVPRQRWRECEQQICAGICWGMSIAWAGLLFVGWEQRFPASMGTDDTWRIGTSGFPIPAIRRHYQEFPPGTQVAGRGWSFRRFDFADWDWIVFVANTSILVAIGILACRRIRGHRLRWVQLVGALVASGLTLPAMAYLYDSSIFSMMDWNR